jgi:hypothetical protein
MLPWVPFFERQLPNALRIMEEYFKCDFESNELARLFRSPGAREHETVLGTNPHRPPAVPELSRETKQFIQWLAETHADIKAPYEVEIRPTDSKRGRRWDLNGFVSWLVFSPPQLYSDGKARLKILYDQELLYGHITASLDCGNGHNGSGISESPESVSHAERFKTFRKSNSAQGFQLFRTCLTKIALHESAHVAWHLSALLPLYFDDLQWRENDSRKSPNQDEQAKRSHEKEEEEAWIIGLFWYALLVGDFALHCRQGDSGSGPDEAWRIA